MTTAAASTLLKTTTADVAQIQTGTTVPATAVPAAPTARQIVSALLTADRPPQLGDTLPSLLNELVAPPDTPAVRTAAAQVREVVAKLLPAADAPPTAEQVRAAVEDGGTHFEAKLARGVDVFRPELPTPATDLKAGLLALSRAAADFAGTFPAAAATLTGIERQQAANVLSQEGGGMAVFQVAFPDGPHWRTLGLGVEPDRGSEPDADGKPTRVRVMMHVPLSGLGETWIDAASEGGQFRATLFISDDAGRERVRGELAGLEADLRGNFAGVSVAVRSADELTDAQRRRGNAVREGLPDRGGVVDVEA